MTATKRFVEMCDDAIDSVTRAKLAVDIPQASVEFLQFARQDIAEAIAQARYLVRRSKKV